jgi:hypothetical protein
MAESLTCDQCGKATATHGMVGWLAVENVGIDVTMFGESPGPWHFCGWHCCYTFAATRLVRAPAS